MLPCGLRCQLRGVKLNRVHKHLLAFKRIYKKIPGGVTEAVRDRKPVWQVLGKLLVFDLRRNRAPGKPIVYAPPRSRLTEKIGTNFQG